MTRTAIIKGFIVVISMHGPFAAERSRLWGAVSFSIATSQLLSSFAFNSANSFYSSTTKKPIRKRQSCEHPCKTSQVRSAGELNIAYGEKDQNNAESRPVYEFRQPRFRRKRDKRFGIARTQGNDENHGGDQWVRFLPYAEEQCSGEEE